MKRNGGAKSLLESQALVTAESNIVHVSTCICGEEPTQATYGVRDHGATMPCPYYECKSCNIDSKSSVAAYPGEWDKAAKGWNEFIGNLKSRCTK